MLLEFTAYGAIMKFRFGNLTPIEWIGLILPTVGVAISTIVFSVSGVGAVGWTTLIGVIITYLTAEKISRIAFEHEVRRNFVLQKRAALDLICLGGAADGIKWFGENLEGLERVENTVFTRGDNTHIIDQATWNRHLLAIKAAINTNCLWTDIATSSQVDELRKFRETLPELNRKRYNLFSLTAEVPLMQCMTLRYNDGTSRVLFGWDFASTTCKSDYVFLGEGERVCSYFNQYMSGLEQAATKVTPPPLITGQQQPPAPAPVVRQATVPPGQ